ncbi:MAG: SRPBCC domain-containing protein [Acidobacteria bacterium]|nr:SRPBCC domain-containing protein [Acidobacteriota bacterium]
MILLETSRNIAASAYKVFAAFADGERLARWFGPAGFTNTFHTFEFESGGRWVYTMHGPDGKNYENESVFREVVPGKRIVIEHISLPKYELTIALAENGGQTKVTWIQDFENETFATKMTDFLKTANEQNLDKLSAEVLGSS